MPEYMCAVTQSHRRSYDLPQDQPPQCCGKPMALVPDAPSAPAPARYGSRAGPEARAIPAPGASAVPRKEWWQHWK
ncbi:MAG: hypothetical protein HY926_00500 [Elusimicrobia bacterium]|nr:hypothetical protein [Elusimicrobiota bacterium]